MMKSNNRLLTIMLIILVSLTLVGGVALIAFFQLSKHDENKELTIDEIVESSIDIPEITTNLEGDKFIRISMKVQTESPESAEELTKRDFQVNNILISELSEMSPEDLDGRQGKLALEDSIKNKINELMNEGEVQKVYITSYIIQ